MTKKEALIKALVWRVAMIIQGLIVAYYFVNNIGTALGITIVMNALATIFYYLFDLFWFNHMSRFLFYQEKAFHCRKDQKKKEKNKSRKAGFS